MRISLLTLILTVSMKVQANEADVISASAEHIGGTFFRFEVTVQHHDESWEHFVKAWEVLDDEGTVLGARILAHPHVKEQPFTRFHTINIPEEVHEVRIRAYDLVHQYGGKEITLKLNKGNQK